MTTIQPVELDITNMRTPYHSFTMKLRSRASNMRQDSDSEYEVQADNDNLQPPTSQFMHKLSAADMSVPVRRAADDVHNDDDVQQVQLNNTRRTYALPVDDGSVSPQSVDREYEDNRQLVIEFFNSTTQFASTDDIQEMYPSVPARYIQSMIVLISDHDQELLMSC